MPIKFFDLARSRIAKSCRRSSAASRKSTKRPRTSEVPRWPRSKMNSPDFLGARHVVSVASGTDALRLALLAIGIGAGDEVITTPMTFIATAEAIVQTGARPAFVDIDPTTGNMSVPGNRALPGTRALHVAQRSARDTFRCIFTVCRPRMIELRRARRRVRPQNSRRRMPGARRAHQRPGAAAVCGRERSARRDASAFIRAKIWAHGAKAARSPPTTTSWPRRFSTLRDHGRLSHYAHSAYGYNARLDTMQAAVLRPKLERLEDWNARRRRLAALYRETLPHDGLTLLSRARGNASRVTTCS